VLNEYITFNIYESHLNITLS